MQENVSHILSRDVSIANLQISSMNYFYMHGISEVIRKFGEFEIQSRQNANFGYNIRMENVSFTKTDAPIHTESDGSKRMMKPHEIRIRKSFSYVAPIYCDIIVETFSDSNVGPTYQKYPARHIANVPVMLRSCLCMTEKMTREELIADKECPDDPGGYFLIKGMEKIIIPQEKICGNMTLVWKRPDPKFQYIAEFRSMTHVLVCGLALKRHYFIIAFSHMFFL